MSKQIDLQKIEQNARHTFNEDGLLYLSLGAILTVLGVSFSDGRFSWIAALGIFLIYPVEAIRKRITYPRLGYAKFTVPKETSRGIIGFAVVAIILLSVLALVGNGRYRQYMPFAISVIFALALFFGFSMGTVRLRDWAIIVLVVVGGIVTTFLFDNWRLATAVQFTVTGLLLMALGIIDLIRFIRKYPIIDEEFHKGDSHVKTS